MEVILRRTKINTSIFNQTVIISAQELKESITLGWVIAKKEKWILFYNADKNLLSKLRYIVGITDPFVNECKLSVFFGGRYSTKEYLFDNDDKKRLFKLRLIQIKEEVDNLGQIFI